MDIIPVPYNLGAPERNPKTREFAIQLESHIQKFPFRQLSEDGKEHVIHFLPHPTCGDQKKALREQLEKFRKSIKRHKTSCVIGGDNSICYDFAVQFAGVTKKARTSEKRFLISFDRHPDVMRPSARKVPHATWLRRLIDDHIFLPENVLLVGIGDAEKQELQYLAKKKISFYSISEACRWNTLNHMPTAGACLFVSVDVDILKPSDLPGTGTRRGIGLEARYLLDSIKRIRSDFRKLSQAWCITEAFHDLTIDPASITLDTVESLVREIAVEY